jgi:hypothetical protein
MFLLNPHWSPNVNRLFDHCQNRYFVPVRFTMARRNAPDYVLSVGLPPVSCQEIGQLACFGIMLPG